MFLGKKIKDRRKALKLSLEELRSRMGITVCRRTLSNWEKDKSPVSLDRIPFLAAALEMTEQELKDVPQSTVNETATAFSVNHMSSEFDKLPKEYKELGYIAALESYKQFGTRLNEPQFVGYKIPALFELISRLPDKNLTVDEIREILIR